MGKEAQKANALSPEKRAELEELMRQPGTPRRLVERAEIILRLGATTPSAKLVAREVGVTALTVAKWRSRYRAAGVSGLRDLRRPGQPRKLPPARRDEIVRLTVHTIPNAGVRWSIRQMASFASVTQHQVRQIWREAGIAPLLAAEASHEPRRSGDRELVAVWMDARCALAVFRRVSEAPALERASSEPPASASRERPRLRGASETLLYRGFRLAMVASSSEAGGELRSFLRAAIGAESVCVLACGAAEPSAWSTQLSAAERVERLPTVADWLARIEVHCATARLSNDAAYRAVLDFRNALDAYLSRAHAGPQRRAFHWRISSFVPRG